MKAFKNIVFISFIALSLQVFGYNYDTLYVQWDMGDITTFQWCENHIYLNDFVTNSISCNGECGLPFEACTTVSFALYSSKTSKIVARYVSKDPDSNKWDVSISINDSDLGGTSLNVVTLTKTDQDIYTHITPGCHPHSLATICITNADPKVFLGNVDIIATVLQQ